MDKVPDGRVAALLGAGASADAGLPLSGDLTNYLIDHMGGQQDLALSSVLNQVCSAIIAHRGAEGVSPLSPLNVERVISSIRLLRSRDTHEAAPFVANWLPALDHSSPRTVSSSTARQIAQQLGLGNGRPFPGHLERALTEAIREVTGGNQDNRTYARLEHACINAIASRLRQVSDVTYLGPLVEFARAQGGMDVATLNYDLTIETICNDLSEPLCRGLRNGWPVVPLQWAKTGVNLFKIHGSVDWWVDPQADYWGANDRGMGAEKITISDAQPGQARPAMVLGDREKLESQPVTLALIADFQAALARASRLVVVGYSFGDAHINTIIGNWLDQDTTRSVTVLAPWDFFASQERGDNFAQRLIRLSYDGSRTNVPRVNGVAATTAKGLSRALNDGPKPFDEVAIEIVAERRDDRLFVSLVNNTGDPLRSVNASGAAEEQTLSGPNSVSLRDPSSAFGAINISGRGVIEPGDRWELEVLASPGTDWTIARVRITASLPVGYVSRTIQLSEWVPEPPVG